MLEEDGVRQNRAEQQHGCQAEEHGEGRAQTLQKVDAPSRAPGQGAVTVVTLAWETVGWWKVFLIKLCDPQVSKSREVRSLTVLGLSQGLKLTLQHELHPPGTSCPNPQAYRQQSGDHHGVIILHVALK